MQFVKRFMMLIAFLLLLLGGAKANAQSDVRTPDQRVYFPQMDPVLDGMWQGHGNGDGMRYDPQAIACMVRACATIQSTLPRDTHGRCADLHDDTCPYREVRNGNNGLYQACYAAHLARIKQPGYTRLANPPSMTSLVCSVIAAQGQSYDDAVYTAVNGHPRPVSQPRMILASAVPARSSLRPGEAEELLAELDSLNGNTRHALAARAAKVKKPVASSPVATSYGEYPRGFRMIAQDENETTFRVLEGADYHDLENSPFAETHETNSVKVMSYKGNDHAQTFFPYHFKDGKIELYHPRMHLAANDKSRLEPMDEDTLKFVHECDDGSCETRFALQAGETIRLPRKAAATPDAVSKTKPAPTKNPKHAEAEAGTDSAAPAAAPSTTAEATAQPDASLSPDVSLAYEPGTAPSASVADMAGTPSAPASIAAAPATSFAIAPPVIQPSTALDDEKPDASLPYTAPPPALGSVQEQTKGEHGFWRWATTFFVEKHFLATLLALCAALVACIIKATRLHMLKRTAATGGQNGGIAVGSGPAPP